MAACSIFDEDEVCMPTSSGGFKYGLVVESSAYPWSSDDDDFEEEARVKNGTVKVAWHPSGDETVVDEKKLILVDRSLMPGDVVRRLISGKDSQRGFVQSMDVKCHVKVLGTEQYIYNIDAKDISPLQEWDPEPEVTLDSWVGHVMEINEQLTVRFLDGARCQLSNAGMLNLEDINDKRRDISEFAIRGFYPGQELCGTVEDYERATWLNTTSIRGPKRLGAKSLYSAPVTVEKVETKSIDIRWICKGFTRTGSGTDKLESPPSRIEGENLKRLRRLDSFRHCQIQIGDKGYYVIKDSDVILYNMSPRKHATPDIVQIMAKENTLILGTTADKLMVVRRGSNETQENPEQKQAENKGDKPVEISNCVTNGTEDQGECADDEFEDLNENNDDDSDASSSYSEEVLTAPRRKNRKRPSLQTRGMKKLKGKKAKKKSKPSEMEFKPGDRVPIEIWYEFSLCDVMWQDGHIEQKIPSPELYPIHHLDELEFFPGDYVIDSKGGNSTEYGVIESCDHKERTVMVKWVKPYTHGKAQRPDESTPVELSVYDIKDHPDYRFRPGHTVIRVGGFEEDSDLEAVGQVSKLDPTGIIHVWWPSNTITQCYPQELFITSEEFQSEASNSDGWSEEEEEEEEEEASDVSWETEGEEETEADTDTDNKKEHKSIWSICDSKKKDLDELLQRAQVALTGLLDMYVSVPEPFFKSSRQVFQDILDIFKRCKEMEKILKSSFFDDEEISGLIGEIREQMQREKASKFARHVAEIYKLRTNACEGSVEEKKCSDTQECVISETVKCSEGACGENVTGKSDPAMGAKGATSALGAESDDLRQKLAKALVNFGSNMDDSVLHDIIEAYQVFQANIEKGSQKDNQNLRTHAKGVDLKSVENGECVKTVRGTDLEESSVTDIIHSVITSVCDKNYEDLEKTFQSVIERVDKVFNNTEKAEITEKDPGAKSDVKSVLVSKTLDCNSDEQKEEKKKDESKDASQVEEKVEEVLGQAEGGIKTECDSAQIVGKNEEELMPSSHRTLCIRVCKALNSRLLHIQQEVNRKWLAYKFGCDENATDYELFEKMQAKMLESTESNNEPLSAITEEVKDIEYLEKERETVDEQVVSPDKESTETEFEEEEEPPGQHFEGFQLCSETPGTHWFKFQEHKPANQKSFNSAVRKEYMLLRTSLPEGIIVKGFEDRMDLFSVLIKGPTSTPYEDGLFAFDIQLPSDFPTNPPSFHYLSFCHERLNPNLYEDGKVCVSLLGTWSGKGNEVWTNKSSLLQVLISIQGLILVREPYFNEAGYEKQRGTQLGQENSTMYNEMAILKLVQSMTKMSLAPPTMFVEETKAHLRSTAMNMIQRIEKWVEVSSKHREDGTVFHCQSSSESQTGTDNSAKTSNGDNSIETAQEGSCSTSTEKVSSQRIVEKHCTDDMKGFQMPDFPLLPLSKGFCLTMQKHLETFRSVVTEHILKPDP